MSKISISKKIAWSLILKINTINHPRKDIVIINENISKKNIHFIYDRKSNTVRDSNIIFNQEITNLFDIFLPIVCSSKKITVHWPYCTIIRWLHSYNRRRIEIYK